MITRIGALALVSLTLAFGSATVLLLVLSDSAVRPSFGFPGSTLVFGISCSVVGGAIVLRQPQNAVAWILLATGVCAGAYELTGTFGYYALVERGGDAPGAIWAAWISSWMWIPTSSLVPVFLPLVFPNGRLPSRRWRPLVWYAAFTIAVFIVAVALVPGPMLVPAPVEEGFARNPLSPFHEGDFSFGDVQLPTLVMLLVAIVGSLAAIVRRFRGSRGVLRLQMKWFVFASALTAMWMLLIPFLQDTKPYQIVGIFVLTAIPIAAAIAILRYHLYDIDLLIKGTIVYGLLSAILAGVYVGLVVFVPTQLGPITSRSELAIAASTLVTLALFQPLRRRVQGVVDRRFYRSRYDAARTLEVFADRLRDEVNLDDLRSDLIGAVERTMAPAHVSLWLREPVR